LAGIAARAGISRYTLIDPDVLAMENIGRHMLARSDVGTSKVIGVQSMIEEVNPHAEVETRREKFSELRQKPDLLVAATDSFACQSLVNDYSLREGVPAIYGGCWGEASAGEILYVVPGKTPCYECYAGFRRKVEIPPNARKYSDPDFDSTKVPGQAGLWANILVITGVMFQVVLGLLDPDNKRARLIDFEHTLFLINVSNFDSNLQPLAVTFGKVRRGCAVCDESQLQALGKELQSISRDRTESPEEFMSGRRER
jgi:ThiF family